MNSSLRMQWKYLTEEKASKLISGRKSSSRRKIRVNKDLIAYKKSGRILNRTVANESSLSGQTQGYHGRKKTVTRMANNSHLHPSSPELKKIKKYMKERFERAVKTPERENNNRRSLASFRHPFKMNDPGVTSRDLSKFLNFEDTYQNVRFSSRDPRSKSRGRIIRYIEESKVHGRRNYIPHPIDEWDVKEQIRQRPPEIQKESVGMQTEAAEPLKTCPKCLYQLYPAQETEEKGVSACIPSQLSVKKIPKEERKEISSISASTVFEELGLEEEKCDVPFVKLTKKFSVLTEQVVKHCLEFNPEVKQKSKLVEIINSSFFNLYNEKLDVKDVKKLIDHVRRKFGMRVIKKLNALNANSTAPDPATNPQNQFLRVENGQEIDVSDFTSVSNDSENVPRNLNQDGSNDVDMERSVRMGQRPEKFPTQKIESNGALAENPVPRSSTLGSKNESKMQRTDTLSSGGQYKVKVIGPVEEIKHMFSEDSMSGEGSENRKNKEILKLIRKDLAKPSKKKGLAQITEEEGEGARTPEEMEVDADMSQPLTTSNHPQPN